LDPKTGLITNDLAPDAKEHLNSKCGVNLSTTDEACKDEKVKKYVEQCVAETNKKAISNAAKIKSFRLVPVDFTVPGGELTPTLKLRRGETVKKYQDLVNEFYKE